MSERLGTIVYVAVMIAVIVAVDVAFFRNRFWERLAVNIGIVLVFAAFYFRFSRDHDRKSLGKTGLCPPRCHGRACPGHPRLT